MSDHDSTFSDIEIDIEMQEINESTTTTQTGVSLLKGNSIASSISGTVISRTAMEADGSGIYGFKGENLFTLPDEDAIKTTLYDSIALTQISMLNMTSNGDGVTTAPVNIYAHMSNAEMAEPLLNSSFMRIAGSITSTYYVSYDPWSYSDAEEASLKSKFGFNTATYSDEAYEGTRERIETSLVNLTNDLASNVLARIDVSKITNRLSAESNLLEEITSDETAESNIGTAAKGFSERATTTVRSPGDY